MDDLLVIRTSTNGVVQNFPLGSVRKATHCFACNSDGRWDELPCAYFPACGHILHLGCYYFQKVCPLCFINFTEADEWEKGRVEFVQANRTPPKTNRERLMHLLADNQMWTSEAANQTVRRYVATKIRASDRYPSVPAAENARPTGWGAPSAGDAFRAEAIATELGGGIIPAWNATLKTLHDQYSLMPGHIFSAFAMSPDEVNKLSFDFVFEMESETDKLAALCDFAFYGARFGAISTDQLCCCTAAQLKAVNYPYFRLKLHGLKPADFSKVGRREWETLGLAAWTN